MPKFAQERDRLAKVMAEAWAELTQASIEAERARERVTRAQARLASLKAEHDTYLAADQQEQQERTGDLSRMTIREAIMTVLREAAPEPVQVREIEQRIRARGKHPASGISVDLSTMKQEGAVVNPRWGFWTVP